MPQPSRSLNLSGASNFRDLGGYAGLDGRPVVWRKLFRSDHLGGLTAQDAAALRELGLSRAFDFRGLDEGDATPYDLPGIARYGLPIEPTVVQGLRAMMETGRRLTAEDAVRQMQDTYRAFVHDNAARFATLFEHLLDSDAPLVFHCTAGKDRTGLAAALILLALEVPRPVVMHDYLLTNDLYKRPPRSEETDTPLEVLQVVWKVQREFLEAALHAIDVERGGLARYLKEELRVGDRERARLASLYLARSPG